MKTLTTLAFMLWFSVAWAQQAPPAAQGPEPPSGPEAVPVRLCPTCTPQRPAANPETVPKPTTAQVQTKALPLAPVAELLHPEWYAVSFLPLVRGNESVAFVIAPTGKLGTLPMGDIAEAYRTGYRPFTVADLLAITNAVADEEKNLQRKIKELSEDYDALAARYNRLAEINSTPSVQPQPAYDERQAMRALLFRSLLQRAVPVPPVQIQVQTVDCTKFPALCVNH